MGILDDIRDVYEHKARVIPGLLVALPIIVPLVCVYGPQHPTLTAVVGLLATCGVMFALANIARGRGKKVEERLVRRWGGLPTTLALRHRDSFLDSVTKNRYHTQIKAKLGIAMPTREEEEASPRQADDAYSAASHQLRELTRGGAKLLLKENIAYGFHRNMLGMKGPGIVTSLGGLFYGLVISEALTLSPVQFTPERLASPGLAGGVSMAVSFFLLAAWLFYFDEDKVRLMGFAYAERLFEQLASLPMPDAGERSAPPR